MKTRWIVSMLIVAAVLAVSVAVIARFRDAPFAVAFQAVGDGSGGAILAWRDKIGIRAQHLGADGKLLWANDGLLVHASKVRVSRGYGGSLALFKLTADGVGGAFLTWQDRSEFPGQLEGPPVDLYTQRIGPDGELLWGLGIKAGMVAPISMDYLSVVPDGTGGAVLGWDDYKTVFRALHDDFLRLQKVTPEGRLLWGDEGVLVTASKPYRPYNDEDRALGIQPAIAGTQGPISRSWPTYTGNQIVAGDGEGGAFAVWSEEDYPSRTYRVYAQRVDENGTLSWPEPVLLKSGGDYPGLSVIESAEKGEPGGAILSIRLSRAYADPRPPTTLLRLQIDGTQSLLKYASSLAGVAATEQGALIAWRAEGQSGPPQEMAPSLYVQKLAEDGSAAWEEIPVIETAKGQSFGNVSFASAGGDTVVSWRLSRMPENSGGLVRAQRIDAEGRKTWDEGGLAVFSGREFKYQGTPTAIGTDSGTIIIAPVGKGALVGDMILAQKVDRDGNWLWGNGVRIDRQARK